MELIRLNTEKGLIRVESWEDIQSRPGFVSDLNPKEKKLKTVIGSCEFKEKIKCGLSNCHSPHNKGFIATTVDGYETNIGKDCGKTHFGIDFKEQSNRFIRDADASDNRQLLWSFSFKIEDIELQINELRKSTHGADWIYGKCTVLTQLNKGCPKPVLDRLYNMVKTQNPIVTIDRIATAREIEEIEAIEGRTIRRPHYIEEPVAEIKGIEVLYPENSLRNILILDIEKNLDEFKKLDIDQLSYTELKRWAKWSGTVEDNIERAKGIIEKARVFLTSDNLSPFLDVIQEQDDKNEFRKFLQGLI